MNPTEKYTVQTVLERHAWSDKLFSFKLTRPASFRFTSGQFARLGLTIGNNGFLWRAYSMCSASTDEYLEFYSIVVPNGAFTPKLVALQKGDRLLLEKQAFGFFTVDRLPAGRDIWLLATGTGLAPYLSILQDPDIWHRFERILLVHGVRYADELSYQEQIKLLPQHPLWQEQGNKLHYIPVVTRDTLPGTLHGRLPALIQSGELFDNARLNPDPAQSRFMICGNPQMVHDTHQALMEKGFRLSRLSAPGQIVLENGW